MAGLQRDVAVLPSRDLLPLGLEHPQGLDQAGTSVGGFDHVVDEPSLGSDVRVAELTLVLGDELTTLGLGVGGMLDFLTEDDVHGSFRAHDGDLRGGPGEGGVGPRGREVTATWAPPDA